MKMIRIVPVAALVLVVGSAYGHAGMHGPGAEFDKDKSGGLSLAEYTEYLKSSKQDTAAAATKFAELDKNKNGSLSSAEFIVGLPKQPAATKN